LRWNIAEWLPAFFSVNLPFIFQACFSTILIWKLRRKFLTEELIIYFFFLYEAISSVRNVPLWVIISLPLTIKAGAIFVNETKSIIKGTERMGMGLILGLAGSLILLSIQGYSNFKDSLNEKNFYPAQAVNYLTQNPSSGNLFSDYNWGGYLIWKLPDKKTFVDGRMPDWDYKNCPVTEACDAMQDYLDISKGKVDYKPVFDKYQVNTVLLATPRKPGPFDRILSLFQKTPTFDLTTKLLQDGWHEVYRDNVSDILQR
jgi:hypothetical protein